MNGRGRRRQPKLNDAERDRFEALVDRHCPAAPLFVEVGVADGDTAVAALKRWPETTYIGVDPYSENDDKYKETLGKLAEYPKASLLHLPSIWASQLFAPNVIDVLLLDADHTPAAVRADLENWWPAVRCLLFGHHDLEAEEGKLRKVIDSWISSVGSEEWRPNIQREAGLWCASKS
jgi:hypothetical protein